MFNSFQTEISIFQFNVYMTTKRQRFEVVNSNIEKGFLI